MPDIGWLSIFYAGSRTADHTCRRRQPGKHGKPGVWIAVPFLSTFLLIQATSS